MTLLARPPKNESDAARLKRLSAPKKLKRSDHECFDDMLSSALEKQWDHAALWSRSIREHLKTKRGLNLTLAHCRDLLALALEQKPMTWVSITRCSPSKQIVENMIERLEDENSRIFIQPEIGDHISVWRTEANARRAVQAFGAEHCRRRWYRGTPATTKEIEALYPKARQADWLPHGHIA